MRAGSANSGDGVNSTYFWTRAVWRNPPVGGAALLVLLRLADRADASGRCYPGASSLASDTRMTVRSVRNALASLQQLGVLEVETRGGGVTSNRYRLNLCVESTSEEDSPVNDVTDELVSLSPGTTFTPPVKKMHLPRERRSPKHPVNAQLTPSELPEESVLLPTWVDAELWLAYEAMRKGMRRPIKSALARKLLLEDLKKLREAGHDPKRVLEESIKNGWQGLFPLKTGESYGAKWQHRGVSAEERQQRIDDETRASYARLNTQMGSDQDSFNGFGQTRG